MARTPICVHCVQNTAGGAQESRGLVFDSQHASYYTMKSSIVFKVLHVTWWWENRSTVLDRWTTGQKVERSILHLGHASYQKFISLA